MGRGPGKSMMVFGQRALPVLVNFFGFDANNLVLLIAYYLEQYAIVSDT